MELICTLHQIKNPELLDRKSTLNVLLRGAVLLGLRVLLVFAHFAKRLEHFVNGL